MMTMLNDDLLPKQIDDTATKARRLLLDRGLSDADIDNAAQGRMDAIQVANDDDTVTDEYLLASVLMACRDAQKRLNSGDIVEAIKRYSGQHEQVMYIANRSLAQSGRASKEGGGKGGKVPGRREWAEWAAQFVTRWDDFPEPDAPWTYETNEVLEIYRDGDTLVAANVDNEKQMTLARSTVEKRYIQKPAGQ